MHAGRTLRQMILWLRPDNTFETSHINIVENTSPTPLARLRLDTWEMDTQSTYRQQLLQIQGRNAVHNLSNLYCDNRGTANSTLICPLRLSRPSIQPKNTVAVRCTSVRVYECTSTYSKMQSTCSSGMKGYIPVLSTHTVLVPVLCIPIRYIQAWYIQYTVPVLYW